MQEILDIAVISMIYYDNIFLHVLPKIHAYHVTLRELLFEQ